MYSRGGRSGAGGMAASTSACAAGPRTATHMSEGAKVGVYSFMIWYQYITHLCVYIYIYIHIHIYTYMCTYTIMYDYTVLYIYICIVCVLSLINVSSHVLSLALIKLRYALRIALSLLLHKLCCICLSSIAMLAHSILHDLVYVFPQTTHTPGHVNMAVSPNSRFAIGY